MGKRVRGHQTGSVLRLRLQRVLIHNLEQIMSDFLLGRSIDGPWWNIYILLRSEVEKRLALIDPTKQPKVPLHRHREREELQTQVAVAIDPLYTNNHTKTRQLTHHGRNSKCFGRPSTQVRDLLWRLLSSSRSRYDSSPTKKHHFLKHCQHIRQETPWKTAH